MKPSKKEQEKILFKNLKKDLSKLKSLLEEINQENLYEDKIYRFYHQSYKAYFLKDITKKIVIALQSLVPTKNDINPYFKEILNDVNTKNFELEHNKNWTKITRPMVESFFHAKFFLEMACKYGEELEEIPEILPSGYAALLYFYNLR